MQVLKLIQQQNFSLPFKLGSEIGFGGADGQVFELLDDNKKVIKLSVLYQDFDYYIKYKTNKDIINYLINNNIPSFAKIFESQFLGEYSRVLFDNTEQKYTLYYYILEKLNKISEDEVKVFHSVLDSDPLPILKIEGILKKMDGYLDFSKEKIMIFCENVRDAPIKHLDLHPRNIMKDNQGNFRLIDFDRCKFKEINER